MAVPDPVSYAVLPYVEKTARMHTFMRNEDGSAWVGCPRTQLQAMMDAYAAKGLSVQAALEVEFTLFKPTADGEYEPSDHDGMYSLEGLDRHHRLLHEIMATLEQMGIEVEQMGKEYGAGQCEISTRHGSPIEAVDRYYTVKATIRALAQRAGCIASFMPKPYAHLPGNGLHVHLSVQNAAGDQDLMSGEQEDEALSPLGKHFAAGLLTHAAGLTGVGSPIVNSYKRLLPGSWGPAHVCWGVGNRAALVRVPSMGSRRHIEFRSGDNACNAYFYLIALLAAGLDGIENELDPGPPVAGDVGHFSTEEARSQGIQFLPRTLPEALAAVESDSVLMEALGPIIGPEFLKVKRMELATYNLHVHPWERQMYLEAP